MYYSFKCLVVKLYLTATKALDWMSYKERETTSNGTSSWLVGLMLVGSGTFNG